MTNIFCEFGEIFLCVYAVTKHIFKRNFSKCDQVSANAFYLPYELGCILTSLILYLIISLFLLPFIITRRLIDIYLTIRYGRKYHGLLNNMDAMWTAESNEAKHIINTLLFLQLHNTPQEFLIRLKLKLKQTKNIKFNSSVYKILDYWYRLESDDILDKVVNLISLTPDEISSKIKFEEKISYLSNQPLPIASPFEILISTEPINFYHDEQHRANSYIMIIRLHHTIGDGISLLSFLLKVADQQNDLIQIANKFPSKLNNKCKLHVKSSKEILVDFLSQITSRIRNASIYHFSLLASPDKNILHGPELKGDKILVFHTESEPVYMSKIKVIKNHFEDCKFTDVLYLALSASLWEYFKQHDQNTTKDIHISFVSTCPKNQGNEDNEKINNNFCAVTLDIPIDIDGIPANQNLTERLKLIIRRHKTLSQSIDTLMFYWLCRHSSVLPVTMLKPLYKLGLKTTITFSNLPGIKSVKIINQHVTDIVFWTPNVANVGLGLTVLTYNCRLQIGLLVDKILISDRKNALNIIKNMFKYIDLLAEEINDKI